MKKQNEGGGHLDWSCTGNSLLEVHQTRRETHLDVRAKPP
jgi:hypothetical protein